MHTLAMRRRVACSFAVKATYTRRLLDGRDEPAAPPYDRGYARTQPVAGDTALLRARGRQIRPALQPVARPARAGGNPRLSDPPHRDRHLMGRFQRRGLGP